MRAQEDLGSDIVMALDECTGQPANRDAAQGAMQRSLAWGKRCLATPRGGAALFGIVQGGTCIWSPTCCRLPVMTRLAP